MVVGVVVAGPADGADGGVRSEIHGAALGQSDPATTANGFTGVEVWSVVELVPDVTATHLRDSKPGLTPLAVQSNPPMPAAAFVPAIADAADPARRRLVRKPSVRDLHMA
jgi:hypothetical protein